MKRFSSACRFEPRTNTYAKFFMRCTYELKLLKRQFFFPPYWSNAKTTTTTTRAQVFYRIFKKLDLKGTDCFLKNWNFSGDKFKFLIIRVFIILNYFSFKRIKANNSVVSKASISFVLSYQWLIRPSSNLSSAFENRPRREYYGLAHKVTLWYFCIITLTVTHFINQ